jgi:hypothetical protein
VYYITFELDNGDRRTLPRFIVGQENDEEVGTRIEQSVLAPLLLVIFSLLSAKGILV